MRFARVVEDPLWRIDRATMPSGRPARPTGSGGGSSADDHQAALASLASHRVGSDCQPEPGADELRFELEFTNLLS